LQSTGRFANTDFNEEKKWIEMATVEAEWRSAVLRLKTRRETRAQETKRKLAHETNQK
jgi:hypothetical protein